MKSLSTKIREGIKNFILSFYYLLWWLFDPSKFIIIKKEKIKKILIIHLGAVGELLFASTLMPTLKKNLRCDISILVNPEKEWIFENNPYISEILTYKKNFKENLSELKKRKFDSVFVIYPGSTKIYLMCLLAGIRYRIGFSNNIKIGPSFFLTRMAFPIIRDHAIEKTSSVIRMIGIKNKNTKLEYYPTKREEKDLKQTLNKLKVKDYMIVHPGFSSVSENECPSRLWPLNRYSEIVDYLIEKYKINIFLTGTKNEKILSEKIKENVKNKNKVIIANELFPTRKLAMLVSNARLLVSCGTGIVQLATSFDTPTVLFEGKGDALETSPPNSKKFYRFLYHPEVCTGCEKEYCRKKTTECMKAITLEEVKKAIDDIIKENYQ